MRTVRFLEKRTFERVGLPAIIYEAGSVHTLKDDHARRWVSRGAAVYVADVVAAAPEYTYTQVGPTFALQPETEQPKTAAADEVSDDDSVASAPAVDGQDGGDPGVGAVNEPVRRRGRPAGRRSGNRGQ